MPNLSKKNNFCTKKSLFLVENYCIIHIIVQKKGNKEK